jgi:hypothetical protein
MSTFHRAPCHMNGQVNHQNYWIWEAEKHEIPVCLTFWKWTHGVDFCKWPCCRTCPFLQKTPLRETSISAWWNCLLMCKSIFSQMNATALNVLQQSTATQTAEHIHTCTLAEGQHQNYVTCWTIKQGSSFSMILYRECCNIYCVNKLQNQKIRFV